MDYINIYACVNGRIRSAGPWLLFVALLIAATSGAKADIIWRGDAETGNFDQWHDAGNPDGISFWLMQPYGKPDCSKLPVPSLICKREGNGELADVVTSPVRQGNYAYKFTVKSDENWVEPDDCDQQGAKCGRRRTELRAHHSLSEHYNALPYLTERWISVSVFLPADWEGQTGDLWGPLFLQSKPDNSCTGISPWFAIALETSQQDRSDQTWTINHRWAPNSVTNPCPEDVITAYSMFYDKSYPRSSNWSDGLAHFPSEVESKNALGSINKGGWTDWVINWLPDARNSNEGGTGFLKLWKREDSGPWVQVLNISPGKSTRHGVTFNHGIGYKSPAGAPPDNGGFGLQTGMYMHTNVATQASRNRVVYIDNVKIGDENSSLSEMAPDSAVITGGGSSRPMPPSAVGAQ